MTNSKVLNNLNCIMLILECSALIVIIVNTIIYLNTIQIYYTFYAEFLLNLVRLTCFYSRDNELYCRIIITSIIFSLTIQQMIRYSDYDLYIKCHIINRIVISFIIFITCCECKEPDSQHLNEQSIQQNLVDNQCPSYELSTDSTDTCCICLEKINKLTKIRKLPCLHIYHKECIDEWFRININMTCPQCKYKLVNNIV